MPRSVRIKNIFPEPMLPPAVKRTRLYADIATCTRCPLYRTCTNIVYGRGNPRAPLWFIGEAPGKNEDEQGYAFVGRSGRLLQVSLAKKNIDAFFVTNIVKCRPPDNRDPEAEEIAACSRWLVRQLEAFRPRVIVAMGRYSIGYLSGYTPQETARMTVGKHIGKVRPCPQWDNTAIMPTYHPSYLLRNGSATNAFLRQLDRANKLCDTLAKR